MYVVLFLINHELYPSPTITLFYSVFIFICPWQAFGIGAFEDEEESDVYSSDRMSNYDRVLGGEEEKQERRMYGWTGPPPQRSSKLVTSFGHDVIRESFDIFV